MSTISYPRIKMNWNYSDMRNFLVLLGKHIRAEDLELIPSGLILKQPVESIENGNNTYIDIIGIPFRQVYNRARFKYRRIYLSEFYDIYKKYLGSLDRPLRIEYNGNDDRFLEDIKKRVQASIGISYDRFVFRKIDFKSTPKIYSLKFKIEESEFTTKDSGLSLYNDIDLTLYVDEPIIELYNGYGKLSAASYLRSGYAIQANAMYVDNSIKNNRAYNTLDQITPPYSLVLDSVVEAVESIPDGTVLNIPSLFTVRYNIPKSVYGDFKFVVTLDGEDEEIPYIINNKGYDVGQLLFSIDANYPNKKVHIEYTSDKYIYDLIHIEDISAYIPSVESGNNKFAYSKLNAYGISAAANVHSIDIQNLRVDKERVQSTMETYGVSANADLSGINYDLVLNVERPNFKSELIHSRISAAANIVSEII